MINPTWLNTFCTLVEVGHFTKTADKLFMTQSGVSQHIAKLETQLETPLLIREGKSFSLTNVGKTLYKEGLRLLQSFEALEHVIKQDNKYEGQINIASPGSVGLKLYSHLLALQQKHPKLVCDYMFAPNTDIELKLFERQCDIGLMTELSKQDCIVCEEVANEPLVLVTPASVENVGWESLVQLGFISHPDAKHHAQQLLSRNFEEFEQVNQFVHRGFSNHISLICEPVSLGLGFTVLPLYAAKAFKSQSLIGIHHLAHPVYESLYFCVNNKAAMSERVRFLKKEVTNYLKG
jgi:DNA-binding transcriptional LysR family regulator